MLLTYLSFKIYFRKAGLYFTRAYWLLVFLIFCFFSIAAIIKLQTVFCIDIPFGLAFKAFKS